MANRIRRTLLVGATVLTAALGGAACGSSGSAAPTLTTATTTTSTVAPTTAPTTAPPTTTTTVAVPPAPQASAEAAADALIDNWKVDDRSVADTVATAPAVESLFASPYGGQTVISRGCTDQFPPLVCTYGTYGGGNSSSSLYEVYVSPVASKWYVSSVVVES